MKLSYKFAFWYLIISLIALALGGMLSFYTLKNEIDQEQARYLKERIDFIAGKIERGVPADSLISHNMEIRLLTPQTPEMQVTVTDTLVWHHYAKRLESEVKVSASRVINGRNYYISTHDSMVESDDITEAVLKSLTGIFIILLIITGVLGMLISRRLLAPFYKTLQAIQSFRLRQKPALRLSKTNTAEFTKLNTFLNRMTQKAQHDYRSLKEFTENASHELQTPLAIIRGKLELLMDSEIDDRQAKLIMSAHNAVEKLSKMSQSLTLLTRLENHEFESSEQVYLSRLLQDSLFDFRELIEMKLLTLEQEIAENVQINMHPILADILLSNLLSNAIRHNQQNGKIKVKLTDKNLVILNSGEPLDGPAEEMFIRFKKNNQVNDSVGLGLAIVKQICEQSGVRISYKYESDMHTFVLVF